MARNQKPSKSKKKTPFGGKQSPPFGKKGAKKSMKGDTDRDGK